MFGTSGNNGGDDGNDDENNTYTEYVVYDMFDTEQHRVDTPEEAEVLKEDTLGGYIEQEDATLDASDDEQDTLDAVRDDPFYGTEVADEDDDLQSADDVAIEVEDAWADTDDDHTMPERDDSGVEVLDGPAEVEDVNDGYAFWQADATPSLAADGETRRWTLGDHEVKTDVDTDHLTEAATVIRDVNPDLADALEQAASQTASANISNFECPACGLNHGHSDAKHDIRSSSSGFSVTATFADFMEFCPYCHCGVNELAMLIDFYNHIDVPVFEDAGKFAAVGRLRNADLIDICTTIRESEEDHMQDTLSVDAAIRTLGLSVSQTFDGDIRAFYKRWKAIKQAADGAPIAGSTRSRINNIREGLNDQFGY